MLFPKTCESKQTSLEFEFISLIPFSAPIPITLTTHTQSDCNHPHTKSIYLYYVDQSPGYDI